MRTSTSRPHDQQRLGPEGAVPARETDLWLGRITRGVGALHMPHSISETDLTKCRRCTAA